MQCSVGISVCEKKEKVLFDVPTLDDIRVKTSLLQPSGVIQVPPSSLLFSSSYVQSKNDNDTEAYERALKESEQTIQEIYHQHAFEAAVTVWNKYVRILIQREPVPEKGSGVYENEKELIDELCLHLSENTLSSEDKIPETDIKQFREDKSIVQEAIQRSRKELDTIRESFIEACAEKVGRVFLWFKNSQKVLEQELKIEENLQYVQQQMRVGRPMEEEFQSGFPIVLNERISSEGMGQYETCISRSVDINSDRFMEFTSVVTSCGKVRQKNEDRWLSEEIELQIGEKKIKTSCYAVFDGHGGKGDYSKRESSRDCVDYITTHFKRVLGHMLERFNNQPQDLMVYNALTHTFLKLQGMWTQHAMKEAERDDSFPVNSGTTACVVLRINNDLYCANLGDSRAVLISPRNTITELSEDMSASFLKYQSLAMKRGGKISCRLDDCPRLEGVLAMTGALGNISLPSILHRPEIKKVSLDSKEISSSKLAIASDGVWDVVLSSDMKHIVSKTTKDAADHIMQAAYALETWDNATIMMVGFFDLKDLLEVESSPKENPDNSARL